MASLTPVPAYESLATLDTTHSYFIHAEEGEETKHLHRELIMHQNQELRGSWLLVLGSDSGTGLPFLLVGIMANALASDFAFTGVMKKSIIC